MSFSARLEDLELSSLLHLIALNRNSGRLRLTRSDAHALLVFREGRVIYAATNAVRQTFGSILLLRGLINEVMQTADRGDRDPIYVAWDEYNVWYRARSGDAMRGREAPGTGSC